MTYSDNSGSDGSNPSLLPYDEWFEEAHREVMLKALETVAKDGLPGDHNFYIQFKTDYPEVIIPSCLKAKYPKEITIVLQHQFWDLNVNRKRNQVSVGLSFGGIGSILYIPFGAIIGFADPSINLAFQFKPTKHLLSVVQSPAEGLVKTLYPKPKNKEKLEQAQHELKDSKNNGENSQVVSLDAFRKKTEE